MRLALRRLLTHTDYLRYPSYQLPALEAFVGLSVSNTARDYQRRLTACTPRSSSNQAQYNATRSSNYLVVPADNASAPGTRLVRRVLQDVPPDKDSQIKSEMRLKHSRNERIVVFKEHLDQSGRHDHERTIWRLLDVYELRRDFRLWLDLATARRRSHGVEGIRLVWRTMLSRNLDLPVEGPSADGLWTHLLELGFEDPHVLEEIFIYVRAQKEAHGRAWPHLYASVLSHHIRASSGKTWLCHMRLHKHFPPTSQQFQQLLTLASPDEKLRQIYLKMHESFPYIHLYDFAISELCKQGLYATAAMWHEKLIRRGDCPSDARKAEPVLRFLAVSGDKSRLMEYTRLMVEAGVSFAAYRDKNVKIPSFISHNIVVPPLGQFDETPEKKLSDGFCARLFATRVFSVDTVIGSLVFLGAEQIGPQALREMAARDLCYNPFHQAVQARLDQLREAGISTGDSTFSLVVRRLAAEGKDDLLRNVISCDLHSDTFDDHDLQESLLPHYQEQDDKMAFTRTIMILTARLSDRFVEAKRLNYVLRAHLTRRDLSGVKRIIEEMREHEVQVEPKSTMHMRETMLSQRNVGHRPANTKELDFLIRMWQDALRSGVMIPPYAWTEILRRLGMCGRLLAFERLALWLAAWYSSPHFRASQSCNTYGRYATIAFPHPLMSIDIKPSNPMHPLRTLFPPSLQRGIVAWGFQHDCYTIDRRQRQLDWTWGLFLLRRLRDADVHILNLVVAKAFKLRLVTMFGYGRSKRKINRVGRRWDRSDFELYIRKAKEIWGRDLI